MNPLLLKVADQYRHNKEKITQLEGDTAISSLHVRTYNDIRHALDHMMTGLQLESKKQPDEADYHYNQASEHLREHILNSYQIISGKCLRNAFDKITMASPLNKTSRARNLREKALEHHKAAAVQYSRGRELRTHDLETALRNFEKSSELAIQAQLEVEEVTPGEVRALKIAAAGILIAILGILISVGIAIFAG